MPSNASNRRAFMFTLIVGGGGLAASHASAQVPSPVATETDPQASALGYKTDGSKVDAAKYPQHQASQVCGNCTFFQGKPDDATAACMLLAGKQVAGKGWCMAWAKKA
jgi:hypothetical protein